jgi:tetratricopeptide (TPR) repeat protein
LDGLRGSPDGGPGGDGRPGGDNHPDGHDSSAAAGRVRISPPVNVLVSYLRVHYALEWQVVPFNSNCQFTALAMQLAQISPDKFYQCLFYPSDQKQLHPLISALIRDLPQEQKITVVSHSLRRMAMEYIEQKRIIFSPYFGPQGASTLKDYERTLQQDSRDFEDYLADMKAENDSLPYPRNWGDDKTLIALANRLELNIVILTPSMAKDLENRIILLKVNKLTQLNMTNTLILTLSSQGHYQTVSNRPNDQLLAAIKKTYPEIDQVSRELAPDYRASPPTRHTFFSSAPTRKARTDTGEIAVYTTRGEGDCAFHAALGEWDGSEYFCKDVAEQRKRVADRIRACKKTDVLFPYIKSAIEDMVMTSRDDAPRSILDLKKEYAKYLKDNELKVYTLWRNFEKELIKYPDILKFIKENAPAERGAMELKCSKLSFDTCLNKSDELLRAFILSIPELEAAYNRYNHATNEAFDFDRRITGPVFSDYANHIGTVGNWLLAIEIKMLAYALNMTVIYYVKNNLRENSYTLVEEFNPGEEKVKVAVGHNGTNHYERIVVNTPGETLISASLS